MRIEKKWNYKRARDRAAVDYLLFRISLASFEIQRTRRIFVVELTPVQELELIRLADRLYRSQWAYEQHQQLAA